ncbi:hypothetical protein cypCar_00034121 [Cyprinus carpio]|nr:hypothetical protein cypCar_00034121 [Cyprinus carpio]
MRTESLEELLSLHFYYISLQSITWSVEDHGLQEPPFSSLEFLSPKDQLSQTPPAPAYEEKHSEGDLEPVSERNDSQERQRRRKSSFEKLPSLHLFDWSSRSGSESRGPDYCSHCENCSSLSSPIRQNLFPLGTPEYCPPEYHVDHKYHGKPTIVWSLGVLLFMLVCRHYPEPRDIEMIDNSIWSKPDLSSYCCHLIRSLLNESTSQWIDLGEILLDEWFKVTKQT